MAEQLTIEQQRAIAVARARLRVKPKADTPAVASRTPAHGFGGSGTYTRDMSPDRVQMEMDLQRLESLGVDPSSPIIGTGKNILTGLGQLISPFMTNTPTLMAKPEVLQRSVDAAKNVATSTARAPYDMVEGNISGLTNDPYNEGEGFQRANRGAAITAALVAPRAPAAMSSVGESAARFAKNPIKTVATTAARGLESAGRAVTWGPERIASSMIKPGPLSQPNFNFGKDPIAAAQQIPPARHLTNYLKNVQAFLKRQESLLQQAINRRKVSQTRANKPNGIDVEPLIRKSYDEQIAAANDMANTGLADRLAKVRDNHLKSIVDKYKSTYLEADQILAEKRLLRDKVKFKGSETEQLSLNEALGDEYRAWDAALDKLIPEADKINAAYANTVQLEKLIQKRIIEHGDSNLVLKGTMAETIGDLLFPTAIKTNAIRAMNYGKKFEGTELGGTTPIYETFKPPTPDPYGVSNKLFNKP